MAEAEDFYWTLTEEGRASLKIRRSEFIGIAFPVASESEFSNRLHGISREFHGANHHCWASRIGSSGPVQVRSSDDGEPSGSAGKPILQVIEGAELLDVAVIVVRYFGGIKLGTGGLSRAYRDAAREVIANATRKIVYSYDRLEINIPWEAMSLVFRMISPPDVLLVEERYEETTTFFVDVRRSRRQELEKTLIENRISFRVQVS